MPTTQNPKPKSIARLVSEVRLLVRSRTAGPLHLAGRLLTLKRADANAFSVQLNDLTHAATPRRPKGLSRRRLLYLVSVAENLPLDEYPARFRAIGWTKATVLAAFAKENGAANILTLLDLAEQYTVAELRVAIADGELVDGMRWVQLRLTPGQYARFSAVMIQHGATPIAGRGLRGQEEALMSALEALEPKRTAP